MSQELLEWFNLLIRWFHIIAGIMWIGSSLYFVWLDTSLAEAPPEKDDVEGELWMVHSGGFYLVEKKYIKPGRLPETLHWFKWEATFTWLSGILLLAVVYYGSDGAFLIDPSVKEMSLNTAIGYSLGTIVVSWLIYDYMWLWLGKKNELLAHFLSAVLLVALVWFFTHTFGGRAAFIHVGATLGTLMVANVWARILPAQQQMIDATDRGEVPDYSLGKAAKQRSMHNSYMTFPVLFMMVSNHFPGTFGNKMNWLILLLLFIFGAMMRHLMITFEAGDPAWWSGAVAICALLGTMYLTGLFNTEEQVADTSQKEVIPIAKVQMIVAQRCLPCHSSEPYLAGYKEPPKGFVIETPDQLRKLAGKIKSQAVDTVTMPLGNMTNMTKEERETLGAWIDSLK